MRRPDFKNLMVSSKVNFNIHQSGKSSFMHFFANCKYLWRILCLYEYTMITESSKRAYKINFEIELWLVFIFHFFLFLSCLMNGDIFCNYLCRNIYFSPKKKLSCNVKTQIVYTLKLFDPKCMLETWDAFDYNIC